MILNNYLHIIWDWNGTILNDRWLCLEIINSLLSNRNLRQLSTDDYKKIFDFPVIEYYKKAGFNFSKEPFEKVAVEFIDNYELRKLECLLQPGVISCLNKIKELNIPQSLLSASHQEVLEEMIDFFDLRKYFHHVNGLNNHYAGGKIETAQRLIETINIPPEKILLIGDTTHDYEVSNILKCDCLLVSNGHHPIEKLTNCSTQIISNLNELNNH